MPTNVERISCTEEAFALCAKSVDTRRESFRIKVRERGQWERWTKVGVCFLNGLRWLLHN